MPSSYLTEKWRIRKWCVTDHSAPLRFYFRRKSAQKRFDERAAFRDATVGLYHWQPVQGVWVPIIVKRPPTPEGEVHLAGYADWR